MLSHLLSIIIESPNIAGLPLQHAKSTWVAVAVPGSGFGAADASAQATATAKATAQSIANAIAKATNNNAQASTAY